MVRLSRTPAGHPARRRSRAVKVVSAAALALGLQACAANSADNITRATDSALKGVLKFMLTALLTSLLVMLVWILVFAGGITALIVGIRTLRRARHPEDPPSAQVETATRLGVFATVAGIAMVLAILPALMSQLGRPHLHISLGPWVVVGAGTVLLLRGKRRLRAAPARPHVGPEAPEASEPVAPAAKPPRKRAAS